MKAKFKVLDCHQGYKQMASIVLYIPILFVIILHQISINELGTSCANLDPSSNNQSDTHPSRLNSVDTTRSNTSGKTNDQNPKDDRASRQDIKINSNSLKNNNENNRPTRNVYFPMQDSTYNSSSSFLNSNFSSLYQNNQSPSLDQCCACDEAKYELVFEGLWSKYTHPDDFPENYWLAHFSDIIGASHSDKFRMWNQDTYATDGVRELAETGSTKKLESELKQVSSKTRTIIKARELHYPTLNSKTSAVFRTDRQHHLVSILSKLGPSPDWMVGVSGLELCQTDCSWVSQRVINLYLWDAGTDSGTSFTAPDFPTRPQEKIHPIRKTNQLSKQGQSMFSNTTSTYNSNYNYDQSADYQRRSNEQQQNAGNSSFSSLDFSPSDSNSPFGDQSKPFARLTITRQRIYEKSCNGETIVTPRLSTAKYIDPDPWTEPTKPPYTECRYTDWSDWSTCSATCGSGIRTRTRGFFDEQAQYGGCSQGHLIEKEVCLSECVGSINCVTRDWSDWSKCSVNCGQGHRTRHRSPIGPMKRGCESIQLVEDEPCTGPQNINNCTSDTTSCEVTEWSQWSECSVACGKGIRIRTRQYKRKNSNDGCKAKLIQKQSCLGKPELCKDIAGDTWKQVSNPNLPVIDCKLSPWSPWSTCSALCDHGKRTRSRYIIQMPQNGGKPCDKRLTRYQKCKDLPKCPRNYAANRNSQSQTNNGHSAEDKKQPRPTKDNDWRTTTSTTPGSSMMDDEDDSKFARLRQSESSIESSASFTPNVSVIEGWKSSTEMKLIEDKHTTTDQPCNYGNWTQWSDCEVVCQPVKKGSNKVRQKHPIDKQGNRCQTIEELYYCDPNVYC